MKVLGIETSCDETAAAIVDNGRKVRSNIVSSSVNFHKKYGGIIPEIAFRRQLETVAEVVDCALKEANTGLKDIDLISFTREPGLLGSLLVGITFARSLSLAWDIPLIGVDHLYSHIYSGFLEHNPPDFPFIGLVVSGGHTSLYLVRSWDKITLLGSTQDDACGEAFDKTAKILGLGYPGGPVIERLAKDGDPRKVKFGCSGTREPLNFSFSGIKTAVLYYTKSQVAGHRSQVKDICASFQESALNVLEEKAFKAVEATKTGTLAVGGGVAMNSAFREKLTGRGRKNAVKVIFPAREFCMDNAAMVAGLGYHLYRAGKRADKN